MFCHFSVGATVTHSHQHGHVPTNLRIPDPAIESKLFAQTQNAVATRRGKRKRKNRKKRVSTTKENTSVSRALSDSDLHQHVNAQYVNGPGGTLPPTVAKQRAREAKKHEVDEQTKRLHNLDRHPALVLNADYQVRREKVAISERSRHRQLTPHAPLCAFSPFHTFLLACGIGRKPSRLSFLEKYRLLTSTPTSSFELQVWRYLYQV